MFSLFGVVLGCGAFGRLHGQVGVVALFCWCSRVCPLLARLFCWCLELALQFLRCLVCCVQVLGVVISSLVSWFGVVVFVFSVSVFVAPLCGGESEHF